MELRGSGSSLEYLVKWRDAVRPLLLPMHVGHIGMVVDGWFELVILFVLAWTCCMLVMLAWT